MTARALLRAVIPASALAAGCTSFDPSTYSTTTAAGHGGGVPRDANTGGAAPDLCTSCALGGAVTLAAPAILEASGLTASRVHEGVFYVNNDSGDLPRFFAVDRDGALRGVISLAANAVDYEDIAAGPCPAGRCVYVADIGDNDELRTSYTVYRVPEPEALGDQTLSPEALRFVYPDGSHNAETLLVHPFTGEIAVVTKVKEGASGIYRANAGWTADAPMTLVAEGPLAPPEGSPRFTAGSVHPAGRGVLLRTYTHLFFYAASGPQEPLAETLRRAPCALPVAAEPQGEGVGWTTAGDGYVTVSEGPSPPLHLATCAAP